MEGGGGGKEFNFTVFSPFFFLHRENAIPEKSNEAGISKSVAFIRLLSGFVLPCPVNLNQVSAIATISHDFSNFDPSVEQKVFRNPVVSSPFNARQHTLVMLVGALQ